MATLQGHTHVLHGFKLELVVKIHRIVQHGYLWARLRAFVCLGGEYVLRQASFASGDI